MENKVFEEQKIEVHECFTKKCYVCHGICDIEYMIDMVDTNKIIETHFCKFCSMPVELCKFDIH